ncbi:hypothetical protein SmJEL517_g01854 [Synchytrium microbalum]|uniref:L-ascorbate oxidase n=1 Tax=Synchytrium microbalum TaxID=1806994 RepID=A0A507CD72_9FUNG|nr:uncharacterized protein SmJEL517_g01854 [Synchytrium microbalum]TPX35996.1 hypothetical protein SmJEL517_g01854 [Synchytrium microbalum]
MHSSISLLLVAGLLALLPSVRPATVSYTFNIGYSAASPDGVNRTIITVNNTWPAPDILLNKGDRLIVKAYNGLDMATSLHWHGIHQKGSQVMDGVFQTTQCPIAPGQSYTYNFTLEQSGTYWWHAHLRAEYVDGLRGALIVKDPTDPNLALYDDDTIVLKLSDWYHNQSEALLTDFLSSNNPGGVEPVPDSGLINNLGVYACTSPLYGLPCAEGSRYATPALVPGRRYRIRIVNTAAIATFNFSIDSHTMTVIEADGVPVTPTVVDQLEVTVAQRYSIILTAAQPATNYWIRATMVNAMFELNEFLDVFIGAVLRYQGAPLVEPSSSLQEDNRTYTNVLNDFMLVPSTPQTAPATVVSSTTFGFSFMTTYDGDNRAFVTLNDGNQLSYMFPHTPTLQTLAAGLPPLYTTNPINLTANTGSEIIINNLDGEDHPFHLHGHWFWIVAEGPGTMTSGNFTPMTNNPPLRDTLMVRGSGWSAIRFIADNPGAWMFHCHIEWHLMAGLAATVIEPYPNNASWASTLSLPAEFVQLCASASGYVPTGLEPMKYPIIIPDTSQGYAGLPGSTPLLWDVSGCCNENSNGFFQVLSSLTGWRARPTALTTGVYFGYWVIVALAFLFKRLKHQYKRARKQHSMRPHDEDSESADERVPIISDGAKSPITPTSLQGSPGFFSTDDSQATMKADHEQSVSVAPNSPRISTRSSWPAGHIQVDTSAKPQ